MTDSAVFGSDRGEDSLITACSRCRRWRIGYIENKCYLPKIDFNFVDGRKTQHLEYQYIKSKSVSFLVNYNSSASNSAKLIFLWSSVAAGDEEEITDKLSLKGKIRTFQVEVKQLVCGLLGYYFGKEANLDISSDYGGGLDKGKFRNRGCCGWLAHFIIAWPISDLRRKQQRVIKVTIGGEVFVICRAITNWANQRIWEVVLPDSKNDLRFISVNVVIAFFEVHYQFVPLVEGVNATLEIK